MSIKFGHHQTNLTISMFKWYVNLSQWGGFTQAGTRSLLTPVSVPQKKQDVGARFGKSSFEYGCYLFP